MKKVILFLIVFISFASSCKANDTYDYDDQSGGDYFEYNINDIIYAYDIDDKNNLFFITARYNNSEESETEHSSSISEMVFNVMNAEGTLVNSYTTPDAVANFCISNGEIYYIVNYSDYFILNAYNKETQSADEICTLKDYTAINKVEASDNMVYYIAQNKNYVDMEYSYASLSDNFVYSGERIGYIDLTTGNNEDLPIELPITFSKNPDGNLIIYAYDQEKGYYFTIYDIKNKTLSEKIYNNMGQLQNFDVFNKNNDFIYFKLSSSSHALIAASLAPNSGERELLEGFNYSAILNIKCVGEYTYCTDSNVKNIIRIKNSTYLQGEKKLTMINYSNYYTPFGCGYSIERKVVTDEEMALALLSNDDSFDICCMSSMQDISANIRNKGSFYPLNKVKGVTEYLDSCFPYIKEAATNSDGDIWMLPLFIDIPCFIYNESICNKYDINLSKAPDKDNFFNITDKINQDNTLKNLIFINNQSIIKDFFYQYLRQYDTFNNNIFKEIATFSKENHNYLESIYNGNTMLPADLSYKTYNNENTDFLYILLDSVSLQLNLVQNQGINACKTPSLTDNQTNVATCYFLTVNPTSKNLKETLRYISSLCITLMKSNDRIMLIDRATYSDTQVMDDLYDIYSNGSIAFTYPDELYKDDFEKYLEGKKDLESMVKESDRRLDIFLKE